MDPHHLPSEDEVRAAYQLGEEAIVALISRLIETIAMLAAEAQAMRDQLAKDSHNIRGGETPVVRPAAGAAGSDRASGRDQDLSAVPVK